MNSFDLYPRKSASKDAKRAGRGVGSTLGKTCGKGHKGQKSRSGASIAPWFEGGQTPLYRRVPKRGFTNKFAREWGIINLDNLVKHFDKVSSHDRVDADILRASGLIGKKKIPLKLLGRDSKVETDILKGKTLVLNSCSASGRSIATKAGALIEIVEFHPHVYEKGLNGKKLKKKRTKKKVTKGESSKKISER